jgi:hypothetical protein
MEIIESLCVEKDKKKVLELFKKLDPTLLSFLHYLCIDNNEEQAKLLYKYINEKYKSKFEGTMTLTFGDVAESHVGMQKIGKMADNGFSLKDLQRASLYYESKGYKTIIINLNEYIYS